ncbi:AraC family transcriptional regulator [Mucilaginibacter angelicae]|uniref:AraC family transcriptional regulator n=1 Tax=Mucilaginibacter angelicae TaxID=869718 RepID=A0ABV6KZR2_9SPHI
MRLLRTEITPFIDDVVYVDLRDQPFLWSPFHSQPTFHSHPEMELVFIIEGFGKRIIGNKLEPFESGDMVFVGPNLSHVWLSDAAFYEENSQLQSRVIVVYFNPKTLINVFDSVKEFQSIREMIQQSSKGIRIFGGTRDIIADKLIELSGKTGYEKVVGLLGIMNLISVSSDKYIIDDDESDNRDNLRPDKLIEVINFIKGNLQKQITLTQVAEIAGMTEQSFCRFFKKRTRKNYSQYLNDLRISLAKELLTQTDQPISDIAHLCGYNSDSHFCRIFKEHVGESPFKYKAFMHPNKSPY